jgi:predicted membrane-bound dolichyl-phosphate-mannose-protein mannosyltransferase
MKKLIQIILLSLSIVLFSYFIIMHGGYFTRPFDPKFFGDLYSKSQYVIGQKSIGGIGDDGLYAFAGYYYFFQIGDVSAVNFEHPPLGKYLIGLSIFLFRNENVISIFYFIMLLIGVYRLTQLLFNNKIISLLPVLFLTVDPQFLDHLIRSQLDLPFTLFFLFAVYFFIKSLKKKNDIFTSFFFWGCAFSTRFFPFLTVMYLFLFGIYFFYARKQLHLFILASFLIPTIYFLCHISFFIYHPSLIEFLRHKKWMLSWYSGSVYSIGNVWRNIITGYYINPSGKIVRNELWNILLPMCIFLSLIPQKIKYMKNPPQLIVLGITLLYLGYVTILTTGVGKFLMPILPLCYILAAYHIHRIIYSIIKTWKKQVLTRSREK